MRSNLGPIARLARCSRRLRRVCGRMRFLFAPTTAECLVMIAEIEALFGGERWAAMVIGPSLITLRSWKRRGTMSVPSRRLVWLVWVLLLHPERVRNLPQLILWGGFAADRHVSSSALRPPPGRGLQRDGASAPSSL